MLTDFFVITDLAWGRNGVPGNGSDPQEQESTKVKEAEVRSLSFDGAN